MGKRERTMDIAVVILLIVIIVAAVAAIAIIYFKIDDHRTAIYERKQRAKSESAARIMSAAKVITVGQFVYLTTGIDEDNQIIFDKKPIQPGETAPQPVNMLPADVKTHLLAFEWVLASLQANPDGNQLLTQKTMEESGVIPDPNRWVEAGDYLREHYGVIKISRGGNKNGVFTRAGTTLKDLKLALSIGDLPPTPPRESALSKSA